MLERIKKYLMRRRIRVLFRDPVRPEPVARGFGVENGTPLDRCYIERFLEKHRAVIRGIVGEISEDVYTRRFGTGVERGIVFDFGGEPRPGGISGDLTCPEELPEKLFDCFICTQTLNFIYDVPAALQGLSRMLKPGGVLLGTVAGLSQISRFDYERWGDYWRFTDMSLNRLLQNEFQSVETECFGNVAAATAFLDGLVLEQLPNRSILDITDPDYQIVIGFIAFKPERNDH